MRIRAAATWAAAAGLALSAPAAFGLAPDAPQPPKWYETVTVSGWVQLDAIFPEGAATLDKQSNFRIRRARPTISAQIDPATRIQIQVDASTGKYGSGNATATVCDTFAERKVADAGYVLFGQYILPYGAEIWEDNAAVRSPMELSYVADVLGASLGLVAKKRTSSTTVKAMSIVGEVDGCDVLLVDDITETAGTLTAAAKILKEHGAKSIRAAVSHCVLNEMAYERLKGGLIDELITTNSVPIETRGLPITVLSIAPLLGEAILRINTNESVTSLFKIKGF